MYNRTFVQTLFLASVAVLALSTSPSVASPAVTSWDVASEFTDAGNQNYGGGVWTYCEETTLNASCTPLPDVYNPYSGNILGWTTDSGYPVVAHNTNQTAYTGSGGGGPVTFAPHGLQLHPGGNCEYAVTRFTAPAAGTYKISGQFFGLDDNGSRTTTDVHISVNSATPVFTGNVNLSIASMHAASFTSQGGIVLAPGGTVDFQVGCAGDGYNYDSTGLNAVVEAKLSKKKR